VASRGLGDGCFCGVEAFADVDLGLPGTAEEEKPGGSGIEEGLVGRGGGVERVRAQDGGGGGREVIV
jgi:hypothetical protein